MTNNFLEIIKEIQKQDLTMNGVFGLNSLQKLSSEIEKENSKNFELSGLVAIKEIAKKISLQMKPLNQMSMLLGNNFQSHFSTIQFPQNNSTLTGLTSILADIGKKNKIASERLSGFATSQLLLSNNLNSIVELFGQSHLNKFNTINVSIQGISKNYIKNIALIHNWEDISVAEEANIKVANIAEELFITSKEITFKELENFKTSITSELAGLLKKSKTQKAKQYILELMTVISFLLIFYNPFEKNKERTNLLAIEQIIKPIEIINKDILDKIGKEIQKLKTKRVARTNVNLRNSTKNNSKIIGHLKIGQIVNVIEIRKKYLLISYIDQETNEPKSGFVIKKYFEIVK